MFWEGNTRPSKSKTKNKQKKGIEQNGWLMSNEKSLQWFSTFDRVKILNLQLKEKTKQKTNQIFNEPTWKERKLSAVLRMPLSIMSMQYYVVLMNSRTEEE